MAMLIRADHLVKNFPVKSSLLDSLTQKRQFVHAVDDVSFEIAEGEVLGLAGRAVPENPRRDDFSFD